MNFNIGFTVPDWACVLITICFIAILIIQIFKMIPPKIYHRLLLLLFYHNSETYRNDKIAERERVGNVRLRCEETHRIIKSNQKLKEKLKQQPGKNTKTN